MHFNIGPQTAVTQPIILPRVPTVAYNAPIARPRAPVFAGPSFTCLGCGLGDGTTPGSLSSILTTMPWYLKALGVLAIAGGGYYAYRRFGKRRRRR